MKRKNPSEVLNALEDQAGSHKIGYCDVNSLGIIKISNPSATIPAGSIQKIIDHLLVSQNEITVDYIHGKDETYKLGKQKAILAFFFPRSVRIHFSEQLLKTEPFHEKHFQWEKLMRSVTILNAGR